MKGIRLDTDKVVFDLNIMNEQVKKYNEERGADMEQFNPSTQSFQQFIDFIYVYRQQVAESQTSLKSSLK